MIEIAQTVDAVVGNVLTLTSTMDCNTVSRVFSRYKMTGLQRT